MKTTVVHHSADFDGLFCREIARKFLPDAELIGWDFGNGRLPFPRGSGPVYVMDLPPECFADIFSQDFKDIIWIDHHKSAIESHPKDIPGYRIDGVAACRLAWQWFAFSGISGHHTIPPGQRGLIPEKEDFVARRVSEPLAVRLAGEWDIWDHRDKQAELLQFGLDSTELTPREWGDLLSMDWNNSATFVAGLCERGSAARAVIDKRNADVMKERAFLVQFEGLTFLACNFVRCNSKSFASRDSIATGHDALMSFWWDGKQWNVSMYHAEHRKDLDLSLIATKLGGGGHRGACGFRAAKLPFIP